MKAKKRLKNFDFSGENAHMALCHVSQGGAANGFKTLIMKSEIDITKMSEKQIQNLKEIIKACNDLSEEDADNYIQGLREEVEVNKDADGVSPVSDDNVETPNEVIESMSVDNVNKTAQDSVEMIEKAAFESAVTEAIEKAKAEKEAEMQEIVKGLQNEIEKFKAAQLEIKKAEFVQKAAEFEVLGVEDVDAFAVALMKMSEQDEFKVVSEVLEKALNITKNVAEMSEQGHSVEPVESEAVSGVMKALQAKKSK